MPTCARFARVSARLPASSPGIKEDVQRERTDLHELYAKRREPIIAALDLDGGACRGPVRGRRSDPQIADILEHARQQQAEWLQQRAALEAELDAMRRRAAEQAEALSEQKRLAGQQQAELAGELKRMRSLLEALGSQVRGEPAAAGRKREAAAGRQCRAGLGPGPVRNAATRHQSAAQQTKQRTRPRRQVFRVQ